MWRDKKPDRPLVTNPELKDLQANQPSKPAGDLGGNNADKQRGGVSNGSDGGQRGGAQGSSPWTPGHVSQPLKSASPAPLVKALLARNG